MLRLAILFLVLALVAAYFGFEVFASYSRVDARVLFVVCLTLAAVLFVGDWLNKRPI